MRHPAEIFVAPYELRPRSAPLNARASAGPRQGALLRVEGGIADLHPWPELGDLPLAEQLTRLARGEFTPLTAASVAFAREDSLALTEHRSLFAELEVPPSHVTCLDARAPGPELVERWLQDGYPAVKIKIDPRDDPRRLGDWTRALAGTPIRLRVDANESLGEEAFVRLLDTVDAELERFDFFEDPFPYETSSWERVARERNVRLAADRALARSEREAAADVWVIKPALHGPADELLASAVHHIRRVIFTSAMDHPVGQLTAAWVAARAARAHPLLIDAGGLLTQNLFESSPFAEALSIRDARLVPPSGLGWGWSAELRENLPWQRLH
jgi:O-succinylbenzoate synthase